MKLLVFYTYIGGSGFCDATIDYNIQDASDVSKISKQVAKVNGFKEVMITNIIKLPIMQEGWHENEVE